MDIARVSEADVLHDRVRHTYMHPPVPTSADERVVSVREGQGRDGAFVFTKHMPELSWLVSDAAKIDVARLRGGSLKVSSQCPGQSSSTQLGVSHSAHLAAA